MSYLYRSSAPHSHVDRTDEKPELMPRVEEESLKTLVELEVKSKGYFVTTMVRWIHRSLRRDGNEDRVAQPGRPVPELNKNLY